MFRHSSPKDAQEHPRNSLYSTPSSMRSVLNLGKNGPVLTPTRPAFRRYSLADMNYTNSPRNQAQTNSPPNISYNAHISTQLDTKSPGLSSRLVQYHKEAEKSRPICQSKYDKLGVFPIVHFFKKDLPSPKRKPNLVNTTYNSADLTKYNSPEHNRMLLENIIKTSTPSEAVPSHNNEANTKSVLDALKEISRKRIHSSEDDFMSSEHGKRMYLGYDIEANSRKRAKPNLLLDDSTSKSCPSKRICMLDELGASRSSTEGFMEEEPPKRRKSIEQTNKKEKVLVHVRGVDVETQTPPFTIPAAISPPVIVEQPKEKENVDTNMNTPTRPVRPPRISPVKIFDDSRLETLRRNRLSVLLGALAPPRPQFENNETEKTDKPLVSILSGSGRSPIKNNKHVTFNIPETSVESQVSATAPGVEGSGTSNDHLINKMSPSLFTPIVSSNVVTPNSKPQNSEATTIQPISSAHTSVSSTPVYITPTPTLSNFLAKAEEKKTETVAAPLGFTFVKGAETASDMKTTPTTSSPQKGGFKFDLKEPFKPTNASPPSFSLKPSEEAKNAVVEASGHAKFAFGTPSLVAATTTANNTFNFTSTPSDNLNQAPGAASSPFKTNPTLGGFGKTTGSSFPANSPSLSVSTVATTSSLNTPTLNFLITSTSAFPTTSAPAFPTAHMSGFSASSTPAFPAMTSTPAFTAITSTPAIPAITSTPAFPAITSTPAFPTRNSTPAFPAATSAFPTATSAFPTTSMSTFPTTTTSFLATNPTSNFSSTAASNFLKVPSPPRFSTTSSPSFPSTSMANFLSTASSSKFPTSSTPSVSAGSPIFSTTFAVPGFSMASTNSNYSTTSAGANMFTNVSTPAFGAAASPFSTKLSTSSFTKNVSAANAFSANVSAAFPVVSTTPAFGVNAPTSAPGFSTSTASFAASTTKSPIFNFGSATNAAPMFDSSAKNTTAAPSVFQTSTTTAAPSFGQASSSFGSFSSTFNKPATNAFNTPNSGPALGMFSANATETQAANSSFGVPTTSTFGATNNNNNNNNNPSIFGSGGTATKSIFGQATTTNNPFGNTFGSTTTTTSSIFGGFGTATTTASPFAKPQSFGSSGFGSASFAPPAFGSTASTNSTPSFGAPTNTNFGSSSTTNGFGANSSGFGSFPSTAGAASFGQSSSTFGAANPEPKPFGGGDAGSGANNAFTSPSTGPQGQVFTFGGSGATKTQVFAFGNSEPPKPSFNFTADNGTNPFGANNNFSAAPNFNAGTQPQFNLPPSAPGMFNIGTGGSSTSTRSRVMHKVKRRT